MAGESDESEENVYSHLKGVGISTFSNIYDDYRESTVTSMSLTVLLTLHRGGYFNKPMACSSSFMCKYSILH